MTGSAYRTVVAGTDGSVSSLRAPARAGGAALVAACAHRPPDRDDRAPARGHVALGEDADPLVVLAAG